MVRTNAVMEIVESQPWLLISVTEIVADPGADHKTFMVLPLAGPMIVPPVMFQEYVFPGTMEVILNDVFVVVHVVAGPLITGTGCAAITMLTVTVESH